MVPRLFLSCIEMEGRVKSENEIIYNQKTGYMVSQGKKYVIFPQTYDPLSLIFYLMKEVFSLDKNLEFNLNSNQTNYLVRINLKDKKRYKLAGKDYSVWELNLSSRRRKGDIMRHSLDARVCLLEWKNIKLPLLIKASTNLGNVSLRLEKSLQWKKPSKNIGKKKRN